MSGADRGGSELGRALARLRLSRGLSQEQLAHRSGVSVRTIRDLERGHVQHPRPTSIALLSDALAMTSAERAAFKNFAADLAVYAGAPRRPVPVPCQLPADIGDFTGRDLALEKLYSRVRSRRRHTAVVITAVVGKAGVGKTTLAVHAAHQLRSLFPDGQLYVNLRGAETQALNPADVLSGFLRAFGVESNSGSSTTPDSQTLS